MPGWSRKLWQWHIPSQIGESVFGFSLPDVYTYLEAHLYPRSVSVCDGGLRNGGPRFFLSRSQTLHFLLGTAAEAPERGPAQPVSQPPTFDLGPGCGLVSTITHSPKRPSSA